MHTYTHTINYIPTINPCTWASVTIKMGLAQAHPNYFTLAMALAKSALQIAKLFKINGISLTESIISITGVHNNLVIGSTAVINCTAPSVATGDSMISWYSNGSVVQVF